MKRWIALVAAVLATSGCNRDYFSGQLDLDRVEKGEAYIQQLGLPCGRVMSRVVVVIDAPPWRVFNAARDIEGFPLWEVAIASGRVLSKDGDDIDAEFTPNLFGLRALSPLREHIHVDTERMQASITGYENDWMKDNQIVVKLSPLADGSKTLVDFYLQGDIKMSGASFFFSESKDRMAQTALNFKRVVMLERYAGKPVVATASKRMRLAIPTFSSDGVAPDVARTLTRVFAEEMMRNGAWEVSTPQEIAAMLTYNRQETLLGCEASGNCGVDLGKAIGADRLIVGTIGKVGDQMVVTASLVRVPEGAIEKRASQTAGQATMLHMIRTVADQIGRP